MTGVNDNRNSEIIKEALDDFAEHDYANLTITKFKGEIKGYQLAFEKRFSNKPPKFEENSHEF
jgi:hypothetical protein